MAKHSTRRRTFCASLAASTASIAIPSWVDAAPTGGPKLGVALPLSGDFARLGEYVLEAVELGARSADISTRVVDTRGEPAGAVEAINRLAEDPRVLGVLGPLGRRTSRAGATGAQRRGIGMFTLHGDPDINRVGPWVHRLHVGPEEQARAMVRGARSVMRLERAAILYPETAYGEVAAMAFGQAWLADGGVLAGVSSYPERTTDFRRPLGALTGLYAWVGDDRDRRKSPGRAGYARSGRKPVVDFDALFVPDYHARIARVLGFLPGAGIQNGEGGDGVAVQLLGLSGWHGDTMTLTGSMAAGAVIVDVFAGEAGGGRAESFAREFGSRTGREPSDVEAEAFDGATMLGMMMRDVARKGADSWQTHGRRTLVEQLHAMKSWRGVCGEVRFLPDGTPERELPMFRFDMDGAIAPLD